MKVKNQNFLILGVSKSGYSACVEILKRGGYCYLYEELKSQKIESSIDSLVNLGANLVNVHQIDEILPQVDILVISPGVAINHLVAVKAKELNIPIIGEIELGYELTIPTMVCVTGTNGKTTTVSLINAILNQEKIDNVLCGNVGIPLTSVLDKINSNTVCVTEISSFQLESVSRLTPYVSCILNITPDHLERHYSMDNYVFLKKRVFKNQRSSEFTVLNYDDITVKEFAKECKSKVIYVSVNSQVNGAYVEDKSICYAGEYIMSVDELSILGEHGLYDTLFAIAVTKILGVSNSNIVKALKEFKGVKHRVELIYEKEGIKFYNDSKATNTGSTISAIKSMKNPTVLILGGSEKGESYKRLFEEIKNSLVRLVVITGASAMNMINDANSVDYHEYCYVNDFNYAVNFAKMIAVSGENVLLSPACASFDRFSNFEERGNEFCKIVIEVDNADKV